MDGRWGSVKFIMRVCRWPTRSPFSSCQALFRIECFSEVYSLSSLPRSYFLCLWKSRRQNGVYEYWWEKYTSQLTNLHQNGHRYFRYFCVCSDHGGGLVRPEELVLANVSDNILLGGIPGAGNKRMKWENVTGKVFVLWDAERSSRRK